jgi:rhamnogalacturonan acetylesterase
MKTNFIRFSIFSLFCVVVLAASIKPKPVQLFLIGDSTVKNGSGKGGDGLWGWGTVLPELFDTTKIKIHNHAIGGRSSRTFLTEGRWEKVLAQLQPGDYVIMQFGHNDGGAINDTTRARGSIKGIGNETEEIDNLMTKKHEVVYTYGYYMRKYIDEAKAKGAIPIVCSPVPRNIFKDGKIERSEGSYRLWSKQVAQTNGADFIDLFELIAKRYDALGPEKVQADLFTAKDHTHTTEAGARVNAQEVVAGIKDLKKNKLKKYIK